MSLVSYIVVFLMIWMISFFISLPIGVNVSEHHEEGLANSAPDKTNLKTKINLGLFYSWNYFKNLGYFNSSFLEKY